MGVNGKTIVLKFGGAAVASPQQFAKIAEIVLQNKKIYKRVLVVVSAMGDTTNQLVELAKTVNPSPPRREYDMLVSVGERISISLLAMALAAKQQEAVSFTGSQSGIITCDRHSDARIVHVKPHRLISVLENDKIAIVAGFQGVSLVGEITTLGRGGSDTTAVALAAALGAAEVVFFKDVPGVFSDDPKKIVQAELFSKLPYEKALDIIAKGAKVLHGRCVEMAKKNAIPLRVRSFHDYNQEIDQGTLIFDHLARKPEYPCYESVS